MNNQNATNSEIENNGSQHKKDVLITALLFIFLPSITLIISKKFQVNPLVVLGIMLFFIYFFKKITFIFNNKSSTTKETNFKNNVNINTETVIKHNSDTNIEDDIAIFSGEEHNIYNYEISKNITNHTLEAIMNIDLIELNNKDIYFIEAGKFVIETNRASIGVLQRVFKIGYNRAKKIIDELYETGVVSTELSHGQREILMNLSEFSILCYNLYLLETENCSTDLSIHEIKQLTSEHIDYDSMSGYEFEYFCAKLLERNNFKNVEITQSSGDHGIDILAEKDDISYAIQCKCYSSNVGNASVQQAHTGKTIYHKDIAVVLTNQYFTQQAINEANILGVKLWDRDKLNQLIDN